MHRPSGGGRCWGYYPSDRRRSTTRHSRAATCCRSTFLCFVPVPEPKRAKNRIHWDVLAPDVGALVARGARVLREPDDEISWHVLADPEGNEFCAFPTL
ncbi:MAG: VOC family protein [Jiangellaceae bacterium]